MQNLLVLLLEPLQHPLHRGGVNQHDALLRLLRESLRSTAPIDYIRVTEVISRSEPGNAKKVHTDLVIMHAWDLHR
jgi:hypothetical protein